jgi:hypothetical protein
VPARKEVHEGGEEIARTKVKAVLFAPSFFYIAKTRNEQRHKTPHPSPLPEGERGLSIEVFSRIKVRGNKKSPAKRRGLKFFVKIYVKGRAWRS